MVRWAASPLEPSSNLTAMKVQLIFLFAFATIAHGAPSGFKEPPPIFYGKVTSGITQAQVYAGSAEFTITPPTGTAFTISAQLVSLGGGAYSYRVEIRAEKVPSSAFQLSPATIPASATAQTYILSANVNGQPATLRLPDTSPHPGTTIFQEILRGKTERIGLAYVGDLTDTDGDGIPDEWENLYAPATDANDPNDALNDPDGDGFINLMEYALGGDPRTPDANALRERVVHTVEAEAGDDYLTLTVHLPGARCCNARFVVQVSSNLVTWASGAADLTTLIETDTLLKARDAKFIGTPGVSARYLRLSVQSQP